MENMIALFISGGPVMWPLLLCSLLVIGVGIERLIFFLYRRTRRQETAGEDTEIRQLRRNLRLLETIITLSPLLGILGTVTGIITSFRELGTPRASELGHVSQGISQALITTAYGLVIAIVGVIIYNLIIAAIERDADRKGGQETGAGE